MLEEEEATTRTSISGSLDAMYLRDYPVSAAIFRLPPLDGQTHLNPMILSMLLLRGNREADVLDVMIISIICLVGLRQFCLLEME